MPWEKKEIVGKNRVKYDPETETYSCRISIGDKEPLSFKDMQKAMNRAVLGILGRWVKEEGKRQDKELTDVLFWFEEGVN